METEKLKVSIIVPVYNVANYLAKCIDSILAQDEQKWELILVDDGSSDGSGQICDNYAAADHRITVVHKQNEGVSIARNLGISMAQADKICFIDSDDWVEPHYLSDMLTLANDEHTVVYGNFVHDYPDGRASTVGCNYGSGGSCNLRGSKAGDFLTHNRIAEIGYPFAKIFHRKILVLENIQFNPSISLHEDHIFVLQYLLSAQRIALSPVPNYHYVHQATNASLSKKRHPARNMVTASNKLLPAVKAVIEQFSITDKAYIQHLYTMLGLNQLVRTALDANKNEIRMVGDAIRNRKRYFTAYYSPNHSFVKLIPIMFFLRLDKLVLWISRLLEKRI